ncbi:thioredoxin domain-containing protein [Chachezhania sediminis]|uniref:hypothetical protein n=1 Tax=Chachezhania sediminis TaxID=2599291 RepID=UPI001E5CB84C|nr:hypothetical protein [Chachezhania sediminis]
MRTSIASFVRSCGIALALVVPAFAPAQAAELVMVETQGCSWCARWTEEIGPIFPKTEESRRAPLRRVDIASLPGGDIALTRRVVYTPTFLLVEDGRELGRIEGYPGEDFFWGFLDRLLDDHDIAAPGGAQAVGVPAGTPNG